MKKIVFLILLAINFSVCAQQEDQEYDTIVYFPQTIFDCPMLFDPVYSPQYYDNSEEYYASDSVIGHPYDYFVPYYHNFNRITYHRRCDSNWASVDQNYLATFSHKDLVGFESMPNIRCFAQPYYLPDLDTAARVIGVAAKIFGHQPPNSIYPYFRLCDHTGAMIDNSMIFCVPDTPIGSSKPYGTNPYPTPIKYYYFNNQHQIQLFSIVFDANHSWYNLDYAGNKPFIFDNTISIIGGDKNAEWWRLCRYEDLGCYEYLPPLYLMYDSTNWVSFDQDQYYQFYYKKQIGFYPIIIVPKRGVNLTDIELAESCNLVPNPATTYSKAISRYKIKIIEIYDMQGKKIEEIAVNNYEYYINLQNYSKGNYIVNLITQKGVATKKMIVQ